MVLEGVIMSYSIVVDIEKCVGCYNCMVACKDEHVGNSWPPYTDEQQKHDQKWIAPEKYERGTAPYTEMFFITKFCQHCGDAACRKAFPDAVTTREDGIVLLDAGKAKGNKALVDACPFGNISWNDELEVAQKCTMCAHLLDEGWKEPRCVQACPLRALSVVDSESANPDDIANSQRDLQPLTDAGNLPRVLYRGLYRRDTCFIAGSLAYWDGDIERAATEATIKLMNDNVVIYDEKADFFGEFKIDKIQKSSGGYKLICSLDGHKQIEREILVGDECVCLDVMVFE